MRPEIIGALILGVSLIIASAMHRYSSHAFGTAKTGAVYVIVDGLTGSSWVCLGTRQCVSPERATRPQNQGLPPPPPDFTEDVAPK